MQVRQENNVIMIALEPLHFPSSAALAEARRSLAGATKKAVGDEWGSLPAQCALGCALTCREKASSSQMP